MFEAAPMTKAVVFDRYGPPEVLRLAELPDPQAGPGQIRVRVRAAGVQPFDVGVRRGAMAGFVPVSFPQTLGQEYAGVVDQVGGGVTGAGAGDEVLGSTMLNGYAQHVVVAADDAVAKPPELDFPAAVAFVAAAQTASGALQELAVKDGETLLVHAAAGSVGTIAVQLGRRRGARVIGTASPGNHDYLRELGAIPVAYGDGLVEGVRAVAPEGVDVALGPAGGDDRTRRAGRAGDAGPPVRVRRRGPRASGGRVPTRAREGGAHRRAVTGTARRSSVRPWTSVEMASSKSWTRSSRPSWRCQRSTATTMAP